MRLVPRANGNVGLLRGDPLAVVGSFAIASDGISFSYAGVPLILRAKQPLVGATDLGTLFEHSPGYRVKADAYQPDAALVAKLREVGDGYHVRVVFGSWCHVCENFLPRGLKVEEALAGSGIRFEYVGLPTSPWDPPHPEVARSQVKSLPTAIIYKDSKEIGRYAGGDEWQRPEARLWAAISKTR